MIFLVFFLFFNLYSFEVENYNGSEIVKGEILVKFKTAYKESLKEIDAVKIEELDNGVEKYKVKDVSLSIKLLRESGEVEFVQPNYVYRASYIPKEFSSLEDMKNQQWALYSIKANFAWDITMGSTDVVVAVVDTGIDYNHTEFSGRLWQDSSGNYGYDFVNEDNDPYDDEGHGTHCAGIIAANEDGTGIIGIAPKVRIMAVKVLDSDGSGTTEDVVAGIKYAADNGANIISLSLGSRSAETLEEEAVNYAYSKGCVIVAAAGNEDYSSLSYPARFVNAIGVGAIDSNDSRASFSNHGKGLDMVAPGVDVISTIPGGTYGYSGTSMATPYVSGVSALILSLNKELTPFDVRRILVSSCEDINYSSYEGYDEYLGYGKINAYKAVSLANGSSVSLGSYAYPNPFSLSKNNTLTITLSDSLWSKEVFVRIYTLSGELVKEIKGSAGFGVLKDIDFAPGLYFYSIKSDIGNYRGKFLVIK